MIVVLDTNIIISAALRGGKPAHALRLVYNELVVGLTSPALIAELETTLLRLDKRYPARLNLEATLWIVENCFDIVHPREQVSILADEPDNRLLEAAIVGQADWIVSGDKAVLALGSYHNTTVGTVSEWLSELNA